VSERSALVGRRAALARLGLVLAPASLAACGDAALAMPAFDSMPSALKTLQSLKGSAARSTGAWDLAQVLHHAAQSVEYSIGGFPAPKPAWFRASVGPMAFAVFSARGRMSHDLAEPIPGAPAILPGQPLDAAVARVVAALQAFDAHTGPLAPHFAYGALDKPAYTRAHLMHLANHWQEVTEKQG
jgi:hypothetical protein